MGRAKDIFRAYVIENWSSETHQQQQNYAERKYQHVKNTANRMMEMYGLPGFSWLLALLYACFLLNNTASEILDWPTPLERLNGSTPDVSHLRRFHWWQPVYYKLDEFDFPSGTSNKRGHFVGIVEHVGYALTFNILTGDTNKVIHRSNVRPAGNPLVTNLCFDLLDVEKTKFDFIKSIHDVNQDKHMMIVEPEYMIGCKVFLEPLDNGERHRAKIGKAIEDHIQDTESNPERIKFLCSFNDEQYEEMIS